MTNYRFTPGSIVSSVVCALGALALLFLQFNVVPFGGGWPYIVAVAILVLAGAWAAYLAYRAERYSRRLARFARLNHWDLALATAAFRGKFKAFPFGRGINQQDLSALSGTFNGYRCASFVHRYEEGSQEERRRSYEWQIDLVPLEYPLPTIDIVPDDFLAKWAKFLGGQDIDFESYEFNRIWRVKAGDEKYAHDIVHPRMMERLIRADAHGLAIRIEGPAVYTWAAEPRGPRDLARRLGVVTAVARLIPEFVIREFKEVHERAAAAERKRWEAAPDWAKTPYALTSGRYTGIGAEDYEQIPWPPPGTDKREPPPTTPRPPEDPAARPGP